MLDWDKLRVFRAVATAGNLTLAGDILHLSQAAVSRQIRALEHSLSTTLFHRHARGLILTEEGELLYRTVSEIGQSIEAASARIEDLKNKASGHLRVTTTVGFGTLWLAPRMNILYQSYPDLRINLMLEERVLDLAMREADIAIRMKEPSQADLIRRRIMAVRMRLYCSSDYAAKFGRPDSVGDLKKHRLISQNIQDRQVNAGSDLVRKIYDMGITSHLTVNNYYGVLQAVLNNLGIGVLPNYLTEHASRLVSILPEIQSIEIPVYIAYPMELRGSKRVHAFINFVLDEVKSHALATDSLKPAAELAKSTASE